MARSQDGDKTSYEILLNELSLFLNSYLLKKVYTPDFREDIIQEILFAVHKSRHAYDPKRSFMSWFLSIAHYKLTDHIRTASKHQQSLSTLETHELQSSTDLARELIELEDEKLFQDRLTSLDERSRSVLQLLKVDRLSTAAVAQQLNISKANVKVICHRAIEAIKRSIKDRP